MKISTLQSLIDRTSNQIAEYEFALWAHKDALQEASSDFEAEHSLNCIRHYKEQLRKLREVQKELKREIYNEVCKLRGEQPTIKVEI